MHRPAAHSDLRAKQKRHRKDFSILCRFKLENIKLNYQPRRKIVIVHLPVPALSAAEWPPGVKISILPAFERPLPPLSTTV